MASGRRRFRAKLSGSVNSTCKYDERTVESEVARVATSAFDDLGRPRYDKLWRISVLRVVVSFLFRTAILCLNALGIWCLVAGH